MTYLDWLVDFVCDESQALSYQKLFSYLYDRPFYWFIEMDGNRAADGFSLREMYEEEMGDICEKVGGCSVLEVLIGMAYRCEEELMYDPDVGNRTHEWFWMMLENMGLDEMSDNHFWYDHVENIVDDFLDRKYGRDGYGGPFYIPRSTIDMRKTELWYQLNYYLSVNFPI